MKKTNLNKDNMLSHCRSAATKALKVSVIGLVAFSIGCSGENTDSDLSVAGSYHQSPAGQSWDYGLYNLKTFKFNKAEDGHKSKWRDYMASTTLTNHPGVIFIRYEGRGEVAGTIEFNKQVTVHCKFNPKVKETPFVRNSEGVTIDFKDYNGRDAFVSEGFLNPCVTKGGIYKITTKAEFKSEDEDRVDATLEYLFSRNSNLAKPALKFSDLDIKKIATPKPVYDIPTKVAPTVYTPVAKVLHKDCNYYNNCETSGYTPVIENPSVEVPVVHAPVTYQTTVASLAYGPAKRNIAPKTRFFDLRTLGQQFSQLSVKYTGTHPMHIDVAPKIVCKKRFDGSYSDNPLDRVGFTFTNLETSATSWTTENAQLANICGGLRGGIETFLIKGEPSSYDASTSAKIELIAK